MAYTKSKAPADPRGGHLRLYWALIDSPAWRVLTHADVRVYLAIRRRLGKTNNGDISATVADTAHHGIKSSSTLSAALFRLEALGFIAKTRQGGIANGGKVCSLFRFTDEQTFDIGKIEQKGAPPTSDWQRFLSMADARAAVRRPSKNTSKVRTSNRNASTIESEGPFSDSAIEHESHSPVRSSMRRKEAQTASQPA